MGSVETRPAGCREVLSQIYHFGQHTNLGVANASQRVFNARLLSVRRAVGRGVASGSCCLHAMQVWRFRQTAKDSPTASRNPARQRKMAQSNRQVTLARSAVNRRCHVCAFFHSREDEYKVMLPFLKEGLEADEKVFQIIGQRQREERLRRLTDAGVDAARRRAEWPDGGASLGECALERWPFRRKRSGVMRLWANIE